MENQTNFTREELQAALINAKADEAFSDFVLDSHADNRALEIEAGTADEFIAVCREVYKDNFEPAVGG